MPTIVPAVFKCRRHDRTLTEEVVAAVEASETIVAGAGLREGPRHAPRPFKVVVRCPEDDGHDLVFRGSYEE